MSLAACGTSVFTSDCVCKCVLPDAWLGIARCGSLHLPTPFYTDDNRARREQWRERGSARYVRPSRFSQSVLRMYVRRRDSWVESRGCTARCALWENGRFVSRKNKTYVAPVVFSALIILTKCGCFITVLATFYDVVRLVQNKRRFWFSRLRESFFESR